MRNYKLLFLLSIIVLSAFFAYFIAKIQQSNEQTQTSHGESLQQDSNIIETYHSIPTQLTGTWNLIALDEENNTMAQVFEKHGTTAIPKTLTISNNGAMKDSVFLQQMPTELQVYDIRTNQNTQDSYTIFTTDKQDKTKHFHYDFTWIDKEQGLANINGACFSDSAHLSHQSYNTIFMSNSSQLDIAQYQNQPHIKKLFSSNWFFEYTTSQDIQPQPMTLKITDSKLFDRQQSNNMQEKTFPYVIVLQDFKNLKDTHTPTKIAIIIQTKNDHPLPHTQPAISQNSTTMQDSYMIRHDSNTNPYYNNLFRPDNIESVMLYKLNNDESIDISSEINITPLISHNTNPCIPHEYIKNTFWIYDDGAIYVQTQSYTQGTLGRITQYYSISNNMAIDSQSNKDTQHNPSEFNLQATFLHTDCTKEICQDSMQNKIYFANCQESCIWLIKWHIDTPLNDKEKEIYVQRFKITQSLDNMQNSKPTIQIIDTQIQQFDWIALNTTINHLDISNLYEIPKDISQRIAFGVAYSKDKPPFIFTLSHNTLSELNSYFDSKIFSNAITPRSLNEKVTCQACALFIPHSPLESTDKSLNDKQFYISSQNAFLINSVAFHEISEYTKELIFEKEGFFGGDKKITCTQHLGKWVRYKKGKSPQILTQDDFTQKNITKYFK